MKSADYKEQNYQFKTNINMKTKTSILALTKAFFILIVSVCLFSCGSNLPTNKTMEKPYIVKSIETFDKGLCLYNLETGVDNINYRDNISVVPCNGFVQFFIFRINSVVRCINEFFAYAFICIVYETLVPAPFLNFLLYIHLLDI